MQMGINVKLHGSNYPHRDRRGCGAVCLSVCLLSRHTGPARGRQNLDEGGHKVAPRQVQAPAGPHSSAGSCRGRVAPCRVTTPIVTIPVVPFWALLWLQSPVTTRDAVSPPALSQLALPCRSPLPLRALSRLLPPLTQPCRARALSRPAPCHDPQGAAATGQLRRAEP